MKFFIQTILCFFAIALKTLLSKTGEVSLPSLYRQKELKRQDMQKLWDAREKKQWTKEQRSQYEILSEESKTLEKDIKHRIEFEHQFKLDRKAETKELDTLNEKANLVNIIRSQCPEDWGFKVDKGPIREIQAERLRKHPELKSENGIPIRLEDLSIKKRANVTTADASAGAVITEDIQTEIVPNLYEKSWSGIIGASFYPGRRGDFVLPGQDAKPASGFINEGAEVPESSVTYKKSVTLKPLRAGVSQPITKLSLIQDSTQRLQQDISNALLREFAKKIDDEFLNGDGVAPNPRGLLQIADIQTKDSSSVANQGGDLTFGLIKDCETLLEDNDQEMPGTWLLNSRTMGDARQKLRNNVAGSLYIAKDGQFGDMRAIVTNLVSRKETKGTSGAVLSSAVLVVPSSIVIPSWYMPTLEVDYSIGRKAGIIWLILNTYTNIGIKRAKDLVHLKNLKK